MSEKDENITNNEELTEETHENDGHKSSTDKKNQKNERRQQIQPGLFILILHRNLPSSESGVFLRSACGTERPFRASGKNARYGWMRRSAYPR